MVSLQALAHVPLSDVIDQGKPLDIDDPEQLGFFVAQNALGSQRGKRLAFQIGRADETFLDPLADAGEVRLGGHPGKHAVERGIAGRRAVDHVDRLGIGIDFAGQRQVEKHGADQGVCGAEFARGTQIAGLFVHREQHHFFQHGQHGNSPWMRRTWCSPLISKTFLTGGLSEQTANSFWLPSAARAACSTARIPALEI